MYVRLKSSKQSRHQTLQIVESIRSGAKVKQRVVASLGIIEDEKNLKNLYRLTEHLIRKIKDQGFKIPEKIEWQKLKHTLTAYDGFGLVVNELFKKVGFSEILRSAQKHLSFDFEEVVKLMLVQRFALPGSKLRTFERQKEHGFDGIELQHLYRAMDALEPLDDSIQKQTFHIAQSTANCPIVCFFFDVTTLYFESVEQDELRDFGFSKDQKYHTVQIVLALVVDRDGVPLTYSTFPGNLAETKTLIPVLEKLRSRVAAQNVTVVCDRGMASQTNIEALQKNGFQFVIASKLRSIAKKYHLNDLSMFTPLPGQEQFPEQERVLFRTLPHPQYETTKLYITYSPVRAEKDRKDRERLLTKLHEKLSDTSNASNIKKVISNNGYKKYTTVVTGSAVKLNQSAIDNDVAWDGFHGIAVSDELDLSVSEALGCYRDLWHVEDSFRIAKSTLCTRPMFHWAPRRIKAHVLLCFMNLFLERILERFLYQKGVSLSPDRIRYALSQVHTMYFEDSESKNKHFIRSSLNEDAMRIFDALNLPKLCEGKESL